MRIVTGSAKGARLALSPTGCGRSPTVRGKGCSPASVPT